MATLINHWLTFTGPGYVPTSTDEISAVETTGGRIADIGIIPSDLSVPRPDPADVQEVNFEAPEADPDAEAEDDYDQVVNP